MSSEIYELKLVRETKNFYEFELSTELVKKLHPCVRVIEITLLDNYGGDSHEKK